MKKNKFLISGGALILAIAAFMTTSAHKKFTLATSAFIKTTLGNVVTLFTAGTSTTLTTVKGVSKTAYFRTSTGTVNKTIFGKRVANVLSKTLFFKH